jgi:RNA polymerase sigma-70 factor (ECF subfamily)
MNIALTDRERLLALDEAERTFPMNEEEFRAFYELTARPVWLYLARVTGDRRLADDLLQEAYYRLLRTSAPFENDDHRRNYLFRIAANLVRDQRRQPRIRAVTDTAELGLPARSESADETVRRLDLTRALGQLKPRERSMLWLAYAQGCSHEEIAATMGVKSASLKAMLFRARRRLRSLLGVATTTNTGGRK